MDSTPQPQTLEEFLTLVDTEQQSSPEEVVHPAAPQPTAPPSTPEGLYSLNKLSRKLDIPYSRAFQLLASQTLRPDFIMDRNYLFRANRLDEIKEAVAAAVSD